MPTGIGPAVGTETLLVRLRRAACLTQEELAERAGLSVRAVSKLESCAVRRPHRSSLSRLADALMLSEPERTVFVEHYRRTETGTVPAEPPAQLPAGPALVVGRDRELAHLDAAADANEPIVVIDGLGGIGKTTLALHWARTRATAYPDGAFYLNLHGCGPMPPLPAGAALGHLLRSAGVPGDQIPADLEFRAALWRSRLASRRAVVVLDNAHDVAQVRPLLLAAAKSAVLVTSRGRLDGLCVREGALRLPLAKLDAGSTVRLLRSRLGAGAVNDDALHRVAEFCAGHPLAVCLLAVRLSSEGLTQVAPLLNDPGRSLDLLRDWDDPSALTNVFSWSIAALRPGPRALFCLIALQPGEFIDAGSAAALVGRTPRVAARLLAELHHANLIERSESSCYTMHDLVRRYAAEVGAREILAAHQQEARRRLLTYLHARALRAASWVEPLDTSRRRREPDGAGQVASFVGPAAAAEWLDRELPGILSLVAECATAELAPTVVGLAATLWRYLMISGRHNTAIDLHRHAITAARRCHDRAAEGHALCDLGAALIQSGDWAGSVTALTSAMKVAHGTGDVAAQARAVGNLGVAYQRMGRYDHALDSNRTALQLAIDSGDRATVGRAHNSLGATVGLLGRHDDAQAEFEAALRIARSVGDITTQSRALNNLGELHLRQHRKTEALDCLEQALTLVPGSGDRSVEGDICCTIGRTHAAAGRTEDAMAHHLAALDIATAHDLPVLRVDALNGLGEAARLAGHHATAAERYSAAVADAEQIGYKVGRATALQGLSDHGMPTTASTEQ